MSFVLAPAMRCNTRRAAPRPVRVRSAGIREVCRKAVHRKNSCMLHRMCRHVVSAIMYKVHILYAVSSVTSGSALSVPSRRDRDFNMHGKHASASLLHLLVYFSRSTTYVADARWIYGYARAHSPGPVGTSPGPAGTTAQEPCPCTEPSTRRSLAPTVPAPPRVHVAHAKHRRLVRSRAARPLATSASPAAFTSHSKQHAHCCRLSQSCPLAAAWRAQNGSSLPERAT